MPAVELSTWRTDAANNAGLLDRFGLGGWYDVDSTDRRRSIVGLDIRDRHFNLESALALHYVFLHELICHAFQGTKSPANRQNADTYCPWSEGWMDVLALELANDWALSSTPGLPGWITNNASTVKRLSSGIHDWRFQTGQALSKWQADRRSAASKAFTRLRLIWSSTDEISDHLVTAFSVRVNVVAMTPADRKQLGVDLVQLLAGESPHLLETAGVCSEFAQGALSWVVFHGRLDALLHRG